MNALLEAGWSWYPSVLIGFAVWTLLYEAAVRRVEPVRPAQRWAFHTGTLVGLLALVSPLDSLGDEYLFSAHMVQHLLLMFTVAPLWLAGTPGRLVDALLPGRLATMISHITQPLSSYLIFTAVMWAFHIPVLYEMAQENETIHAIEHLIYIGAALIGWWPTVGGNASRLTRPAPPVRMLYLFLLAIPCTVLAAILTFSDAPLYPFYVTASHPFGLSALEDQRLGGLLMWLPSHIILLGVIAVIFLRWFGKEELETRFDHPPVPTKEMYSYESKKRTI